MATTTALALSPPCSTSSSAAVRSSSISISLPVSRSIGRFGGRRRIRCEVATPSSAAAMTKEEEEELRDELTGGKKIGARVRVSVPLKVYHVPRVPEVDLTGMEGELKQFVGLWKGKRISANFPYKVQFVADLPGRGNVKFAAHLKEDEFEIIG